MTRRPTIKNKTFDWNEMFGRSWAPLNRQLSWELPTTFSNVYIGLIYRIRVGMKLANGTVTPWSDAVSALAI